MNRESLIRSILDELISRMPFLEYVYYGALFLIHRDHPNLIIIGESYNKNYLLYFYYKDDNNYDAVSINNPEFFEKVEKEIRDICKMFE